MNYGYTTTLLLSVHRYKCGNDLQISSMTMGKARMYEMATNGRVGFGVQPSRRGRGEKV